MKSRSTNSASKHRAAIYRAAAKMIEERNGGLTCVRICYAQGLDYRSDNEHIEPFWDLFELDGNDFYDSEDDAGHRATALCLMAAMVEAGDA